MGFHQIHYTLDAVYVSAMLWSEFPISPSYAHYPHTTRLLPKLSSVVPVSMQPMIPAGNVQRFRGGLACKAHRLCVSLNSRLERNEEEVGLTLDLADMTLALESLPVPNPLK